MTRPLGRAVLAALAGLAHAAAFPPLGWWPLVLVGPVGLLVATRGARPRDAALAGLAWGATALALPARWAVSVALARGEGLVPALVALAVLAAAPALFSLIVAVAERRGARPAGVAPFAWVAVEWLRGLVPFAPCSWFTLAHALGDGAARPLCQAAAIAGPAGISLLVVACAAIAAEGFAVARHRPGRAVTHLVVGLGVPVIVWQVGFFLLMDAVPIQAAPYTAVAAVVVQDAASPAAKIALSGRGLERARADFTPIVPLLLWPGGAWPRDPYATGTLEAPLRLVVAAFRRALILGCVRRVEGALVPSIMAIGPDGRALGEHHAGAPPLVIECGRDRLGILFASEAARPEPALAAVAAGATLLVVLGDAPPEWPREARLQSALLASLRACELRRPVLRAAPSGPSFGLDELARPYCLIPDGKPGVVLARLGGTRRLTLYAHAGRFLPHLAVALVLACLAWPRRQRGESSAAAAS